MYQRPLRILRQVWSRIGKVRQCCRLYWSLQFCAESKGFAWSGGICSSLSWFGLVEVEDGVSESRSKLRLRWSPGNGRSAPAGGRGGRQTGDRGPIALSALQRVPISAVIREIRSRKAGESGWRLEGEKGGGDILTSSSAGGGRTTQIAAGNCRDEKPRRRSQLRRGRGTKGV